MTWMPSSSSPSEGVSLQLPPDHYTVLGVPASATAADIGRAYRSRALRLHPDKHADATEQQHATFQQLLRAYTALSDAGRRQQYDQQRRAADLSAALAARTQLWTDVAWTELEYTAAQRRSGVDEQGSQPKEEEPHGEYSYVCKCGYRYAVSEPELDRLLDEDDEQVNEIRLSCESCSLGVRITGDER